MPVTTCNVSSIFECSHNIISLFAIANHFCSPNQDSSLISTAVLTQTTVQQVVGCGFRCSRSGRGELPGIDPLAASSRPLFIGSTLRMDHPCTGGDQRGVSFFPCPFPVRSPQDNGFRIYIATNIKCVHVRTTISPFS